jgi:anti-anti-sigma factor
MLARGEVTTTDFEAQADPDGVVWLSGELDMLEADALVHIGTAARAGGRVTLDLSGLSFIDSSGIRAILRLAEEAEQVLLRDPLPAVRKVLDLSGIVGRRGITLVTG